LGARTHGGQDPPAWTCGSAEDSTGSGWRPSPCQRQRASSVHGSAASASVYAGRVEREVSSVPCKKNRSKRMNGDCGMHRANTLLGSTSTVDTYHLYICRDTVL
jgi:hypothetical protein